MRNYLFVGLFAFCACSASKKNTLPDAIPDCINTLIATYKKEPTQNPPRSIYSYMYHSKKVFYIPAICCDQFSILMDENCEVIAHPDGGFTGKGDGKLNDFKSARTNEKLIWADDRE